MKKVAFIILALIAVAALLCFIPVTQSHDFEIKNNFDNTLSAFSAPGNWQKWHPLLRGLPTHDSAAFLYSRDGNLHRTKFIKGPDSLLVTSTNPLMYDVQQYANGIYSSYAFAILTSFDKSNSVTVRVTEKRTVWAFLFSFIDRSEGGKAALSLKHFLESTREFYGYDMKIENVTDTVFATEMLTISAKEIFQIMPGEFEKIRTYIRQQGITQKNFASVSYITKGDSIQLILGIPVNRFVNVKTTVSCVYIPKGRMLTGIYEGRFDDRRQIYQAFQKYARDHSLENVGATFESYFNDSLPASDSSRVRFKLYYPVL